MREVKNEDFENPIFLLYEYFKVFCFKKLVNFKLSAFKYH